eukprot:Opistho-2@20010
MLRAFQAAASLGARVPRRHALNANRAFVYATRQSSTATSPAGASKTGLYDASLEKDSCGVGFVVNVKGRPSRQIVEDADVILRNMAHRGACGCETNTGDGAGVMTGIPHEYYAQIARKELGVELPPAGGYATGLIFLNPNEYVREESQEVFGRIAGECGLDVLGWRQVPSDNSMIGPTAKSKEPFIAQVFVAPPRSGSAVGEDEVRRRAYMLSKRATNAIPKETWFFVCSLSTSTVTYKGQLTTEQLYDYFPDLRSPSFSSHFALVHSRFSTNTFPSWDRAQPLRYIGHNGEINTVRGNRNWMRAREGVMRSSRYNEAELRGMYPVVEDGGSDSMMLDNVLEFMLVAGNKTLPEAMMMLVPEAWENDPVMDARKRALYEHSSFLMEPWDGPANFAFSDGRYIGGVLDRNGLRPSRYYVTTDDRVVAASEVGVLSIPDRLIKSKGRLQPGRMFLIDTKEGTIVGDAELKQRVSSKHPYREWVDSESIKLANISKKAAQSDGPLLNTARGDLVADPRLPQYGYTMEHVTMLLQPMLETGKEALGSMGNDAPLACLSNAPRIVPEYFKQHFAQVTNPPIDPFREAVVMSLRCAVGPMANLLETGPNQARRLVLEQPVLTRADLAAIKNIDKHVPGWKTKVVDITFPRSAGEQGYLDAVDRACREVSDAIASGHQFAVLSDATSSAERVPASALVALGAVHQHLVRNKQRLQIGLVVETGEAREVHHHCTLIGFGADAVCPYLVYDIAERVIAEGRMETVKDLTIETATKNYIKSLQTGMMKVMAKMGISTLQGYKGAQIFEAVGVGSDVMDKCFSGTASRIGGIDFAVIAKEALARHDLAYPGRFAAVATLALPNPGDYHWRDGGEQHMNSPAAIANLQDAARRKNKRAYDDFVRSQQLAIRDCTLRGLFEFDPAQRQAVPIAEVETAQAIVRRFVTGAMSYGSISLEAHTTLAAAMNEIGGKSNTGEGGEDPSRYAATKGAPNLRSAIKQIASGRFGVTIGYLSNADELQIKMAQGAKPGEGGELPGHKVSDSIAKTRHSTAGVGLISPPPHHDIYSIEDLSQLIFDLKCANPSSRISVKLVSEAGVGVVAAGVAKRHAEHILISGHDGGTGASSWTGIKHAGLPWELGLAETHQTLVLNDLRGRVVLQTDGQLRTGRDVVLAALLGAEEFGFSTAPLIALGCTMMRKCHLNTCPVGIATQDPELRKKFEGQPEHVVNYLFMVAEEVREHMARLGFRTFNEMVGRSDLLRANMEGRSEKLRNLDLSAVLTPAFTLRKGAATHCVTKQDHALDAPTRIDNEIIRRALASIADGGATKTVIDMPVTNINRVVGTTLSHEIAKAHGEAGLPDDSIRIRLRGTAGQSLGAFLAKGVTIELEGDANDYVGKGLSGGTVIVRPGEYADGFRPQDNIIVGNVCLYGATSGKAFIRGVTAERFCVRNSGATAVCEGVGDHGCEYMTGGRVVILGGVGRNFAAGMSGGIAYVLDPAGAFRCNPELVRLGKVEDAEETEWLRETVAEHGRVTGSTVAADLLASWPQSVGQFVRVMPIDYERVLVAAKAAKAAEAAKVEPAVAAPPAAVASASAAEQDGVFDKVHGFMKYERVKPKLRDAAARLKDFEEIATPAAEADVRKQASRCMDCGVPFCQSGSGCPIGNIIPKWNDLVHRGRWQEAYDQLALTNNFPEFTGRVCPAPCEGACVLGINSDPVAIKSVEVSIIDHAFEKGWVVPRPPSVRTGQRVAVIGSGPAGLAAADQLNRAGHTVTVYERADRIGGLLMYGIPNMKLDKRIVQRRVDVLAAEGISFVTNAHVGETIDPLQLVSENDAVIVAVGSTWPRDLPVPGRDAKGIHYAMDFLTPSTKRVVSEWDAKREGTVQPGETIDVKGKDVVVIGGGDTGVDCMATALRQGAKSVRNFEINLKPGERRTADNPWPNYPRVLRNEYGHAEAVARDGKDPREFATMTKEFLADSKGRVAGVSATQVRWLRDVAGNWHMEEVEGSEQLFKADVVLLALGYTGPESALAKQLGLATDARSNLRTVGGGHSTASKKIFIAGDCRRGQSLIVWAIREGRAAAREVDIALMGQTSLPVSGGVVIPQVRSQSRDKRFAVGN